MCSTWRTWNRAGLLIGVFVFFIQGPSQLAIRCLSLWELNLTGICCEVSPASSQAEMEKNGREVDFLCLWMVRKQDVKSTKCVIVLECVAAGGAEPAGGSSTITVSWWWLWHCDEDNDAFVSGCLVTSEPRYASLSLAVVLTLSWLEITSVSVWTSPSITDNAALAFLHSAFISHLASHESPRPERQG